MAPNRRDIWLIGILPTLAAVLTAAVILIERSQFDPTGVAGHIPGALINWPLGVLQLPVFAWMPALAVFSVFHIVGLTVLDAFENRSIRWRHIALPLLVAAVLLVALYIFGYKYGWRFLHPLLSKNDYMWTFSKLHSIASVPFLAFGIVTGAVLAYAAPARDKHVTHAISLALCGAGTVVIFAAFLSWVIPQTDRSLLRMWSSPWELQLALLAGAILLLGLVWRSQVVGFNTRNFVMYCAASTMLFEIFLWHVVSLNHVDMQPASKSALLAITIVSAHAAIWMAGFPVFRNSLISAYGLNSLIGTSFLFWAATIVAISEFTPWLTALCISAIMVGEW